MTPAERMTALQVLADFYEETGDKWKRGMIRAVLTHEERESAQGSLFLLPESTIGASTPVQREGR